MSYTVPYVIMLHNSKVMSNSARLGDQLRPDDDCGQYAQGTLIHRASSSATRSSPTSCTNLTDRQLVRHWHRPAGAT